MNNPRSISGSMPKTLVPLCVPGAVFRVLNAAITFPEAQLPNAGPAGEKDFRWAIVVQNTMLNRAASPCTVLVVPCSSVGTAGRWDVSIQKDEPGFIRDSVAYTTLVQPILKGALEEHLGDLRVETLQEIREKLKFALSL